MTVLSRIAGLGCCLVCVSTVTALAATLDVKLEESLPAPGNNLVQLRPIGATPIPGVPTDPKNYYSIARTDDSAYTLALISIERLGQSNNYFTYEFVVWRNKGSSQDAASIQYQVTSTGSFVDFFKDIPFKVTDETSKRVESKGTLKNVFFPSLEPAPACQAVGLPTEKEPLRVFLSGETPFTIRLNCSDAAAVPRLVSVNDPYGQNDYWKRLAYESQYYGRKAKPLSSKSFDLLKATFAPNVWAAVGARFRHLSPQAGPDDTIVVDVTYVVPPAGLERPLKVEIPIAFYPFISVIVGALSSGVVFGWIGLVLLMLVARKSKPVTTTIGALFLGLVLAVIAFLLLLLAYSANCRLTLFGVEINPSDVLVLFAIGLICGCVALLRAEDLLKRVDTVVGQLKVSQSHVIAVLIAAACVPAQAADGDLALIGMSACPTGNVIGLHRDGTVIQFPVKQGGWRRAGRLKSPLRGTELTCASVDGRETAFVVAIASERIWVIRMDVESGQWDKSPVVMGTGAGVAFDPGTRSVYVSSIKERAIYRVSQDLKDVRQWASIFGKSESIGSLTVDAIRRKLLVGEGFSGLVYSLSLVDRRQDTVVEGLGNVNSLSIDRQRRVFYIADAGRRTIWVVPLDATDKPRPRSFYQSDELKYVTGVAVDNRFNVWFSVQKPARVIVLRPNGKPFDVMQ